MGKRAALTDTALRARWNGADVWLNDGGGRGEGSLVAKISESGAAFYFKHVDFEGKRRHFRIGPYDRNGSRGKTLTEARDKAAELAALVRAGKRDLHAHFERQHAQEERERKALEQAALDAEQSAQRHSLRSLCETYVRHLTDKKKPSARDAAGIFRLHVYPLEDFAEKPAAELTAKRATELLRLIVEAGKGRTAAKCRAYLRAAYSLALRAELEPDAPAALLGFNLQSNPIAPTGALAQFSRARDRALSREELAAYVRRLDAMADGNTKDALRLQLLLGGQRIEQLLRVTVTDFDSDSETLLLRDPKGARQEARLHWVPVVGDALTVIERIAKARRAAGWAFLFTVDGKRHTRPETLGEAFAEIRQAMREAKEITEDFQLRDVRRTVETMLAAMGISRETRAQLQSHGLGGIQQRHYDRHDYDSEKRNALKAWAEHLRTIGAKRTNVVGIKARRAARR